MKRIFSRRSREPRPSRLTQQQRTGFTIAIILAIIGFMIVTQLTATRDVRDTLRRQTPAELGQIVGNLSREKDALQAEIKTLELQLARFKATSGDQKLLIAETKKSQDSLRIVAGVTAVTGPGIRITVNDDESSLHAGDILDLVRELRASGAEAIAVNGNRIVAGTAFTEAGDVLIAGRAIARPFVIEAIGDPKTLEQALTMPGGYSDSVSSLPGARIEMSVRKRLTVPSAKDGGFR